MSGAGCTFGNKCEGSLPLSSWPGKPLKDMGVLENEYKFAILRSTIVHQKERKQRHILSKKPKGPISADKKRNATNPEYDRLQQICQFFVCMLLWSHCFIFFALSTKVMCSVMQAKFLIRRWAFTPLKDWREQQMHWMRLHNMRNFYSIGSTVSCWLAIAAATTVCVNPP
jgi:hypothetical protein